MSFPYGQFHRILPHNSGQSYKNIKNLLDHVPDIASGTNDDLSTVIEYYSFLGDIGEGKKDRKGSLSSY